MKESDEKKNFELNYTRQICVVMQEMNLNIDYIKYYDNIISLTIHNEVEKNITKYKTIPSE